jgi:hypothetical protein
MKNLFILPLIFFFGASYGQSAREDIDLIQSMFGKDKKLIVASFIQLDPAKKDAFWQLYDEYETKRKELGRKRIALLERYANAYASLDDATTDKMIAETAALGLQTDKLVQTYHKKIRKAAGSKPAAQFFQLESYFLSAIRATLLEAIPFIGELD